jgi:hypothetical protein
MTTMKFRFIALAASVLAIAACSDSPQLSSAPDEARMDANASSNGAVQSISGNGDIDTPEIPGVQPGGLRRMELQARRSADGTVSGKLTLRQEWENGQTLEADITCFTIAGTRAYVGAVLKAVNGEPYNSHLALRIIVDDNGEGTQDAPDRASQAAAAVETFQPQAFCTNASLVLPMHDLVRGNLQIRP